MRMITACCARALQKCTGRPYMGFLLICQIFRPTEKTRNQLSDNVSELRFWGLNVGEGRE